MPTVVSTVKLNMPEIKRMSEAAEKALKKTAEALHTEVIQAQVVPRQDGALQGEKMFVDDGEASRGKVSIVHEGPYARRLYYNPKYHFNKEPWEETIRHKDGTVSHLKHDGNPNAKGKWFEDWAEGGKHENFAPDAFRKYFREESGI